jgi:hypothetical protein
MLKRNACVVHYIQSTIDFKNMITNQHLSVIWVHCIISVCGHPLMTLKEVMHFHGSWGSSVSKVSDYRMDGWATGVRYYILRRFLSN